MKGETTESLRKWRDERKRHAGTHDFYKLSPESALSDLGWTLKVSSSPEMALSCIKWALTDQGKLFQAKEGS